jgi:hypothetical protein
VSHAHDHQSDMERNRALDEREIEAVLRGHVPAERPDLEPLARFVQATRAEAGAILPAPRPALAWMLETGLTSQTHRAPRRRRMVPQAIASVTARAAGLGMATKLVAASVVALGSLTTASAAAGVLPDPVQSVVADSVGSVTPFTIPRPSSPSSSSPSSPSSPASSPARDADSPGQPGAGEQVREQARQHGKEKQEDRVDKNHFDKDRFEEGGPKSKGAKGKEEARGGSADPHGQGKAKRGKPAARPGEDRDKEKDEKGGLHDGARQDGSG